MQDENYKERELRVQGGNAEVGRASVTMFSEHILIQSIVGGFQMTSEG